MNRLQQIAKDRVYPGGARIFVGATYMVARPTPNGNLVEVSRHSTLDDAKMAIYWPRVKTRLGVFMLGRDAHTGTTYPLDVNVNANLKEDWTAEEILRREG